MRKVLWIVLLLLIGVSGGCSIVIQPDATTEPATAISAAASPTATATPLPTTMPEPTLSVTATVVTPATGNIVSVEGQGQPGSQVEILVDSNSIMTATVDSNNEWQASVYLDDVEHLLEVRSPQTTDFEAPNVIFQVDTIDRSIRRFLPEPVLLPAPPAVHPESEYATATFVEQKFTPVQVLYATDRNDTGSNTPADRYGTEPSSTINFGSCIVTIPDTHKIGEMETPSIWAFEFSADPARHIILSEINQLDKDAFYASLNARMANSGEAFVFIHGYNVTFEDAARRTAQMAYDLGFQGAPLFYSWPSKGSYWGYMADEQSIERSTSRIKNFLAEVVALTNAHTLHLIAHSMGNRGLTYALVDLRTELPEQQLAKLNQIILAAPDIDAEVFKEQIAPKIAPLGEQVTLYASSSDRALQVSQWLHAFPRAGETGDGLVISDGIYTIDASTVNADFVGHGYPYGTTVIADIFELFHDHDFPGDRFNLESVDTPAGKHWRFRPIQ